MWDKYTQCTPQACLFCDTKIPMGAPHISNPANLPVQNLHKKI